jgi:hypothetical protein
VVAKGFSASPTPSSGMRGPFLMGRVIIVIVSSFPFSVKEPVYKPNAFLHGLSPNQSHAGKTFDSDAYREQLVESTERRLKENRGACPPCKPWNEE